MTTDLNGETFQLVVSGNEETKLGTGTSSRTSSRTLFYYAERTDEGNVFLQLLNSKYYPSGKKIDVTLEELLESYRPEPLFYFNKVMPVVADVNANLEKGEKNLEEERPDLAAKSFKRALEVDDKNIRGLFGLGMAYMAAGKIEESEEILGRLMHLEMAFSQEHTHLFNQFGIRMRKAGMLRQALDYYGKAISLNGQDEHLLFNLGRIHLEMNDLEAALACVTKALLLNSEFLEGKKMLEYLLRLKPDIAEHFSEPLELQAPPKTEGLDLDGLPWADS